ncbi:MAG: hypothetical protein F6K31_12560 [Symploca sp. SIO2G7]|nr:hypothetical protein [Symploca sp. SIO2G7]
MLYNSDATGFDIIGHLSPMIGYLFFVIGYWSLVIGDKLKSRAFCQVPYIVFKN